MNHRDSQTSEAGAPRRISPYLTIIEASALLRAGKLSATELVEAHLSRIEALDPVLHSFSTVARQAALEEAARADRELKLGRARTPLHGIPIAFKDNLATRGIVTTAGSRLFADNMPTEDAAVVHRTREAGAVCLGKTAMHELAMGAPELNGPFPAAHNPWNLEFSPGGSSSGSAAAVSAGLCMAALGTDTGGSIAHPATACGIVGMKATFGRVSKHGLIPLAPSLDHVGPMTRTVADNALMLQALAGYDPADSYSVQRDVPDFSSQIGIPIKGLRIGAPWRFIRTVSHTDETVRLLTDALSVLSRLGAHVVEIEVAALPHASDVANVILLYEAHRALGERLRKRPDCFGSVVTARLESGALIRDEEYARALSERHVIREEYAALFEGGLSAIVSPAREGPADSLAYMRSNPLRRSQTNRMYNLTGMPVLTVPMGFAASGLPIGVTFAGNHFEEPLLYRIGHAYERACEWHTYHPPNIVVAPGERD